jgi:hypothetical protein
MIKYVPIRIIIKLSDSFISDNSVKKKRIDSNTIHVEFAVTNQPSPTKKEIIPTKLIKPFLSSFDNDFHSFMSFIDYPLLLSIIFCESVSIFKVTHVPITAPITENRIFQ